MTDKPLRKPEFITIDKLSRGRSGYNIYAKVVKAQFKEIQTKEGQKIPMVDAVIADQTASAKAFFKGDNAKLIKEGNVIAIRNGVKKIIKGHISLQVDLFGKVTPETKEIKEKTDVNISDQEIKIDRTNRDRPYRGNQGRRFNNRQGGNRRNFNNSTNKPRRNRDDYRDNRDNNRARNNENRNRNNSRRPPKDDLDYERRNNYQGKRQFESKKPRQQYQPNDNRKSQRIPMIKINQIDPGTDNLRFIAKIISATLVQGKNNRNSFRCVLGDQTATVNAFLNESDSIVVGDTVALFSAEAKVVKEHIEIQRAKVEKARKPIERVNQKLNISEKSWVPVD